MSFYDALFPDYKSNSKCDRTSFFPRAFSQVNCTTKKKKKNQHKLMPCFGPERSLEDFFKHYSGTDRLCLCCYCYFCCSSFLYSSGTQWMIEWAYEWISEWAFKWDRLLFSPGLPDEWATKNSGNQMQSLCHICAFCWELQSNIRNTVTKHENFY